MFKTYSAIQALCIDVATNYGSTELFEDRIQWVKDNLYSLESLVTKAKEPELYAKAVMALRATQKGNPIGHLVSLDATCSGISILSALRGCVSGSTATNLVYIGKRADAYTEITERMNEILAFKGMTATKVNRADAKAAIMTACYGSKAKPKDIFGEGVLLDVFNQACMDVAPGAFQMLNVFLDAWQPNALEHTWTMPDGFDCVIRVFQTKETRVEVDELDHSQFTINYKVNEGTLRGVALPANVTHACDAYLLRNLVRRCNYNAEQVTRVAGWLSDYLLSTPTHPTKVKGVPLRRLVALAEEHNIVDTTMINHITESNVKSIPIHIAIKLLTILNKMLEVKPFEVLTIHDCFRCHPNNANTMRYWYKEVMADMAESRILDSILGQITGKTYNIPKLSHSLGDAIRQSNYAIC